MKKVILKRSLATRNSCPRPGIDKPLECSTEKAVRRLLIVVPIRHMPSSNILEIGEHGAPAAVVSTAEAQSLFSRRLLFNLPPRCVLGTRRYGNVM